jgi:hypothetical protein
MWKAKSSYHPHKIWSKIRWWGIYFAGKNSHNGQRSHIQHNSSSCSQLLLVHLTTTANYVSWPTARFNDHWKYSNKMHCLEFRLSSWTNPSIYGSKRRIDIIQFTKRKQQFINKIYAWPIANVEREKLRPIWFSKIGMKQNENIQTKLTKKLTE